MWTFKLHACTQKLILAVYSQAVRPYSKLKMCLKCSDTGATDLCHENEDQLQQYNNTQFNHIFGCPGGISVTKKIYQIGKFVQKLLQTYFTTLLAFLPQATMKLSRDGYVRSKKQQTSQEMPQIYKLSERRYYFNKGGKLLNYTLFKL